ncbi:hypothetical protein [Kribbella sp. NPDC006257]|uniref:hypothetical protein n=1 Tax=Kribbella sp. NPDC006257 TaxID=3156738 RepID=UPI0033B83672
MFDSLGITDTTLAVYRALLAHPEVVPAEIGSVLDLPAPAVDEQLELLRKHELVVIRSWGDDPTEEYAIHPNRGFNLLAEKRREELEHLQKALRQDELTAQEITEQYNHMLRGRTANDTEILIGQERANQRMQQFMPTLSTWGLIPSTFETNGPPEEGRANIYSLALRPRRKGAEHAQRADANGHLRRQVCGNAIGPLR